MVKWLKKNIIERQIWWHIQNQQQGQYRKIIKDDNPIPFVLSSVFWIPSSVHSLVPSSTIPSSSNPSSSVCSANTPSLPSVIPASTSTSSMSVNLMPDC